MKTKTTETQTLTRLCIAHLNDTHSHFEPSPLQLQIQTEEGQREAFASVGGFARIANRVEHWKAEAVKQQRDFLLLHAGDCFQGSLYFSLYKGEANVEMLNALAPDAMALGNHELDMGNGSFASFCRQMRFPLLAGNWNLSQEAKHKPFRFSEQPHVYSFQPATRSAKWIVKSCANAKVAIFGLSIDKMAEISAPDDDTPFESAIEVAQNTVRQIHQQGIRQIIVLSHLGYEGDKLLAESVDGIALIIGGHSHVLQGDFEDIGQAFVDEYGIMVNRTRIVQAGCHAMALGHCFIDLNAQGEVVAFSGHNELLIGRTLYRDAKHTVVLDSERSAPFVQLISGKKEFVQCPQHPQLASLLAEKFKPQVDALANQPLVLLSKPLKHRRIPHELSDPSTGSQVAPLVAQAFHFSMQSLDVELNGLRPQFAIHNAGGVRGSLFEGIVTKADIAGKILPFTISVGCYTLKGIDLQAVLQGAVDNALSEVGTGSGSFPYCYGLRFSLVERDLQMQVENLQIMQNGTWGDVEAKQVYCGCSSAYTMTGREGYDAILKTQSESFVSELSMADCFIEYLQSIESKKSISTQIDNLMEWIK